MPSVRSRGERLPQAAALAAIGGFLDAYTFLAHGGVFANAQTGNVVLFGVEVGMGQWSSAWRHVPPLLAFVAGMVTVELLARSHRWRWYRHPTRAVLVVEMTAFTVVAFLPPGVPDVVVTVVIAWASTLQVGTFRTVGTVSYNTTFTTGNIRSLVSEAASWFAEKDAAARRRTLILLSVVAAFAAGAVLGGLATFALHDLAVILVVPVLAVVLVAIAVETAHMQSVAVQTDA